MNFLAFLVIEIGMVLAVLVFPAHDNHQDKQATTEEMQK